MTLAMKKSTVRPPAFYFPRQSDVAQAVNRLDRLTSGLMIIPLSADRARQLTSEFMAGTVQKEYVARCFGEFPEYVLSSVLPSLLIVHPRSVRKSLVKNRS